MADTQEGGPGEKEANKADSPKPDQEVAPPLVSKGEIVFFQNFERHPDRHG